MPSPPRWGPNANRRAAALRYTSSEGNGPPSFADSCRPKKPGLPDGRVMLRHYLIIDGYNLMHACGLARKSYGPGQLRQCRVQLVRYLARHLTSPERERTTIVFDAREAPPGLPRQMTAEG